MAYTVTADLQGLLSISQVFDSTSLPAATGGGATLKHDQFNNAVQLSSTSSAAITKACAFVATLSGGALTVDLTALTDVLGAALTLNTLKVQAVLFENPSTNANAITITAGASNGHTLMGAAWKIILQPGQWITWYGNEASVDVSSTVKTWDLSGTTTQALNIALVAG